MENPNQQRRRKTDLSSDTLRVRDFELLIALDENGNLTAAAEAVGITQPAASKQLKAVQRRLKMRLYESSNGYDKLTPAARALLPAAVEMVQAFHRGMQDAQEARHGGQFILRIGASSFLPEHWHRLLQSVEMRVHRNVRRHLELAYSEHLLSELQRHDLDVVLVTSPPQNGKFTSQCVEKNPLVIVVREGHPLARCNSVNLSDVVLFPWIFFHRSVHSWLHDHILRRAELTGVLITIVHRINHPDQVPQLLKDDMMVAWLSPAGAEHIARPGLVSIPIDDPEIHLETRLVALAENSSPLVGEYFRCFLEQVKEDRSPVQLRLPIPMVIAQPDGIEAKLAMRKSA